MSDHIYDDDDRMIIFYEMLENKKTNTDSENKFLRGIEAHLEKNGRISIRQYRILQEMYENRQL